MGFCFIYLVGEEEEEVVCLVIVLFLLLPTMFMLRSFTLYKTITLIHCVLPKYTWSQSTAKLYVFVASLSKIPLTLHIPWNLSPGSSYSEFPQFFHWILSQMSPAIGRDVHSLARRHWVDLWNAIKCVFANLP